MEDELAAWENEGGSSARTKEHRMIGTVNQIAWAVQIKAQVDAEFDRVRKVLESVACPSPIFDFVETSELISIKQQRARTDDAIRPLPEFE